MNREEARSRVREYFERAGDVFPEDKERADSCVRKARNLALEFRITIPEGLKRRMCKHCYSYIEPGVNCRVRVDDGKIVKKCLECNRHTRIPLSDNSNI